MNVNVILIVHVQVFMNRSVGVNVNVNMRPVSDRAAHTPNRVEQPKRDQGPTRQIGAERFQVTEFQDRRTEPQAQRPNAYRCQHVRESTRAGNQQRLS